MTMDQLLRESSLSLVMLGRSQMVICWNALIKILALSRGLHSKDSVSLSNSITINQLLFIQYSSETFNLDCLDHQRVIPFSKNSLFMTHTSGRSVHLTSIHLWHNVFWSRTRIHSQICGHAWRKIPISIDSSLPISLQFREIYRL